MEYIDDVTTAFCALAATPGSAIEDWMEVLERFVVLLYDRTSSQESVNQGSKQLAPRNVELLMDFSTQRGLPTKLVTASDR